MQTSAISNKIFSLSIELNTFWARLNLHPFFFFQITLNQPHSDPFGQVYLRADDILRHNERKKIAAQMSLTSGISAAKTYCNPNCQ